MGEPAFLYGHQVNSGCASFRHPSACLMQAETLPHKDIFYPFGNPLFTTSTPHGCGEPIKFPWSASESTYSPFIVVLQSNWFFFEPLSLQSLVCLIYLMDHYISCQPTFESWYGCITSELNAIALTGLANKPVPTAFQAKLCIWIPARLEIASFSCCFFRKYTFD